MCTATINILYETLQKADNHSTQRSAWDCQATNTSQFVIGSRADDVSHSSRKADLLAYLIRKIYKVEEEYPRSIPITNVRLFSLAFLFDWGCMIREAFPVTSQKWQIGKVCAFPVSYYEYFIDKRVIKSTFDSNIWQANSRVLFDVSFDTLNLKTEFVEGHVDAVGSMLKLIEKIEGKYGVEFANSCLPKDGHPVCDANVSKNEFDSSKLFRQIDKEILDYVLTLEPFLDNFEVGKVLDIAEYARAHRRCYDVQHEQQSENQSTSTSFEQTHEAKLMRIDEDVDNNELIAKT